MPLVAAAEARLVAAKLRYRSFQYKAFWGQKANRGHSTKLSALFRTGKAEGVPGIQVFYTELWSPPWRIQVPPGSDIVGCD